ncbi:MAG: hypothetical protein ACK6EB_39665, partial [Planctomyces sp.]
ENLGVRVGPAERAEILTTFIDLTAIATVSSQLLVCAFSSHGFNEDKIAYVMPQAQKQDIDCSSSMRVRNEFPRRAITRSVTVPASC